MSLTYLLPCRCGHKLPVDATQCGLALRCPRCKAQLDVPPLRRMQQLERASGSDRVEAAPRWGGRQALLLVGSTVLLLGIGLILYVRVFDPVPAQLQMPQGWRDAPREYQNFYLQAAEVPDDLTLGESWRLWQTLKNQGINIGGHPLVEQHARRVVQRRIATGFSVAVAVLGGALLTLAFVVGQPGRGPAAQRRRPTQQRPPGSKAASAT
jgi:hypothetical protein